MTTANGPQALASRLSLGPRADILQLLFVAFLFALGIEMLRLFMSGMVFYLREARDFSTVQIGGIALLCFLAPLLAPLLARGIGPRRLLQLSAFGIFVARIIIQFIQAPAFDLALSIIGTILFLSAIPAIASIATDGKRIGGPTWLLGLLTGIALDTAIKGAFGTVDLSFHPNVGADIVAVLLSLALTTSAKFVSMRDQGQEAMPPGPRASLLMLVVGPFLFLEMLLFQNIGQQTALIGWDLPGVLSLIVAANLIGMALVALTLRFPGRLMLLLAPVATVLLILMLLEEQSGAFAAAIMAAGHLLLVLLVAVLASRVSSDSEPRSYTVATLISFAGMLLFLVLGFLYYAAYDIDVGVTQRAIVLAAIVLVAVPVGMVIWTKAAPLQRAPFIWAGRLAALMMLAPIILTISWTDPKAETGDGFPVRVMAYNIHQGFGTSGAFTLEEIAQVIEEESADIVALQEVSRAWLVDGSVDTLSWLSQRLDMDYAWGSAADSAWGNAVLSRYPILHVENHEMPNNADFPLDRAFLWVEIDVGDKRPLKVIATHFHHVRDEGEYRIPQTEAVLERWGGASQTVLLGDLNGTPEDREIEMLAEAGLLDSFVDSGEKGFGFTSPSDGARRRIDYVWTSPDLQSTDYSSTESQASDHLPVAVTVNRR